MSLSLAPSISSISLMPRHACCTRDQRLQDFADLISIELPVTQGTIFPFSPNLSISLACGTHLCYTRLLFSTVAWIQSQTNTSGYFIKKQYFLLIFKASGRFLLCPVASGTALRMGKRPLCKPPWQLMPQQRVSLNTWKHRAAARFPHRDGERKEQKNKCIYHRPHLRHACLSQSSFRALICINCSKTIFSVK